MGRMEETADYYHQTDPIILSPTIVTTTDNTNPIWIDSKGNVFQLSPTGDHKKINCIWPEYSDA